MALINSNKIATISAGGIRAGQLDLVSIIEVIALYLNCNEDYYLVTNNTTNEKIIGTMSETINKTNSWVYENNDIVLTKVDKQTAKILYGKK